MNSIKNQLKKEGVIRDFSRMKSKRKVYLFSVYICNFCLKKKGKFYGFYTSKQFFTSKHAMCLRRQYFPDEIIKTCLIHDNYYKTELMELDNMFLLCSHHRFLCLMLKYKKPR